MMGHANYKDQPGYLCTVGLSEQHMSGYNQVQSHRTTTRASKMGVSPGLQGPGKVF